MGVVVLSLALGVLLTLPVYFFFHKRDSIPLKAIGLIVNIAFCASVGAMYALNYLAGIIAGIFISIVHILVVSFYNAFALKEGWKGVLCGLICPIVNFLCCFLVSWFSKTSGTPVFIADVVILLVDLLLSGAYVYCDYRIWHVERRRIEDFR